ncbi:MAG: 3'-5' exonuclease [Calditrichia bacterium]
MSQAHIALDIETVPAKPLEDYSPTVREKVMEKISRRQDSNPDFDYNYFASIHGDFGRIICISLGFVHNDNVIRLKSLYGDDEADLLTQFNDIVARHRGIYIHYNGLNFDIPFILQRMAHHGITPANRRFSDLRRYSSDPHMDIMMQYYNWDMQKVLPLGILAELHGLPSPKEDLSGSEVLNAYQNGEWERIVRYCEFDTATTLNLWRKLFCYQPLIPVENYQFSNGK